MVPDGLVFVLLLLLLLLPVFFHATRHVTGQNAGTRTVMEPFRRGRAYSLFADIDGDNDDNDDNDGD